MRDVAKAAGGVHPSTVSLALRNHPGISDATRKRVRAAARKLGYRPDPLLDAFNTHRLEVLPHKALPLIAFVADFDSRALLEKSPAHRAIWAGARQAAETLHCHIELFLLSKEQLTPERLHSILRARGIASLVIGACRPATNRLAFDWSDYSAVMIESSHLDVPLYAVCSDHRQAARLASQKLRNLGYERVGLAAASSADLARAGYLLEQSRMPGDGPKTVLDAQPSTSGSDVATWIREHRLDAVITDQPDLQAKLATAALRVPSDAAVALLGTDGGMPQTAGVVFDHARIGAQAVEQVVSLMRTNQRGLPATASCTYVPASWRDGASAPAKA